MQSSSPGSGWPIHSGVTLWQGEPGYWGGRGDPHPLTFDFQSVCVAGCDGGRGQHQGLPVDIHM